jgi:glycosyltransferase involved in cell wall biosynthesis
VFVSVGRLEAQKDHATLLEAFALVRRQRLCRLVILGEGALRAELTELATRLGIAADVAMPGFTDNPAFIYQLANPSEGGRNHEAGNSGWWPTGLVRWVSCARSMR